MKLLLAVQFDVSFGPPPNDPLQAEPVPFTWGLEFATTQEEDAARYQEQLGELLDSPLSDWEVLPRVCLHQFLVQLRSVAPFLAPFLALFHELRQSTAYSFLL